MKITLITVTRRHQTVIPRATVKSIELVIRVHQDRQWPWGKTEARKKSRLPAILIRLCSCTIGSLTTPSQKAPNCVRHRLRDLTSRLRLGVFDIEQTDIRPIPDTQRRRTANVYLSPYEGS